MHNSGKEMRIDLCNIVDRAKTKENIVHKY